MTKSLNFYWCCCIRKECVQQRQREWASAAAQAPSQSPVKGKSSCFGVNIVLLEFRIRDHRHRLLAFLKAVVALFLWHSPVVLSDSLCAVWSRCWRNSNCSCCINASKGEFVFTNSLAQSKNVWDWKQKCWWKSHQFRYGTFSWKTKKKAWKVDSRCKIIKAVCVVMVARSEVTWAGPQTCCFLCLSQSCWWRLHDVRYISFTLRHFEVKACLPSAREKDFFVVCKISQYFDDLIRLYETIPM